MPRHLKKSCIVSSETRIRALLPTIREKKALDDDLKAQMNAAIKEFKVRFVQDHKTAATAAK